MTADEVLRQLDASLEALRTDHVDLYQFHSGSRQAFDDPEPWPALAEQVQAGRIRHLGISISKNDDAYQKGADIRTTPAAPDGTHRRRSARAGVGETCCESRRRSRSRVR